MNAESLVHMIETFDNKVGKVGNVLVLTKGVDLHFGPGAGLHCAGADERRSWASGDIDHRAKILRWVGSRQ